jgi:hypothetical protein
MLFRVLYDGKHHLGRRVWRPSEKEWAATKAAPALLLERARQASRKRRQSKD